MTELNKLSLVELLKGLDTKLYFYPNPGNAGDSLIACATFQFFEKHGINYETVGDNNFDATNKTVVYGGGGNFGGEESRAGKFVSKYKGVAKNVVIMPHTIFGAESLLASLGDNAYLICRERVSYDFVTTTASEAHVFLHDDIVFQVDVRKLLEHKPKVNFIPYILKELMCKLKRNNDYDFGLSLRGLLAYLIFKYKKMLGLTPTGKVLKAFRIDVERTSDEVPIGNMDLSAMLELSSCKKDLATLSCHTFLSEIDAFDEVHTNRLHIAIAAVLLEKKVKLYANNYYKIRAIYDYSIRDKYHNVEWCIK